MAKTAKKKAPEKKTRKKADRPYRGDFPFMKSIRLTPAQNEFVVRVAKERKLYFESDAIRSIIDAAMVAEKEKAA